LGTAAHCDGYITAEIGDFRRAIDGAAARYVYSSDVSSILARHQTHASSFQLARSVTGIANDIIVQECVAVGVPSDYIPQVLLSGLSVMRGEDDVIIASPYDLGL
jgi:hypothetical protein